MTMNSHKYYSAGVDLTQTIILTFGFLWTICHGEMTDWCTPLLHCEGGDLRNTMCAYGSEDKNVGNCTSQEDLAWTDKSIRNYWLALHNTFRDRVAAGNVPGLQSASDMLQLVWDDTLTTQARRWAFQCKYEEDPCTRSPFYQNHEPETVYNETRLLGKLVADSSTNVRAAVLTRFLQDVNGYTSFPSKLIDQIDERGFDTFEKVNLVIHAHARIREIGAALILYKWFEGGRLYPFLKSNTYYGPPIIDKGAVYKKGQPCYACPEGYKCNRKSTYTHLCAKASDPADGEYTDGLPRDLQASAAIGRCNQHSYMFKFIIYTSALTSIYG